MCGWVGCSVFSRFPISRESFLEGWCWGRRIYQAYQCLITLQWGGFWPSQLAPPAIFGISATLASQSEGKPVGGGGAGRKGCRVVWERRSPFVWRTPFVGSLSAETVRVAVETRSKPRVVRPEETRGVAAPPIADCLARRHPSARVDRSAAGRQVDGGRAALSWERRESKRTTCVWYRAVNTGAHTHTNTPTHADHGDATRRVIARSVTRRHGPAAAVFDGAVRQLGPAVYDDDKHSRRAGWTRQDRIGHTESKSRESQRVPTGSRRVTEGHGASQRDPKSHIGCWRSQRRC